MALPRVAVLHVTEQGYAVFYRDIVAGVAAWLDGSPARVLT